MVDSWVLEGAPISLLWGLFRYGARLLGLSAPNTAVPGLQDVIYQMLNYVLYMSYHIISYHLISYYLISYHIISYHIISYHIISYHIISYHIISHHIIPYYIYIYHILCTVSHVLYIYIFLERVHGNDTLRDMATSPTVAHHTRVRTTTSARSRASIWAATPNPNPKGPKDPNMGYLWLLY